MKPSQGQVAVELAVVLPLACFFIFALAELCFLYNAEQTLLLATFRAARSYVVKTSPEASERCLARSLSGLPHEGGLSALIYCSAGGTDKKAAVRAVYLYKPLFPVIPLARFYRGSILPEQHSDLVRTALQAKTSDQWADKIKTHVALAAVVELDK